MKHTNEPDAPLFQQPKPGKGFNFREMAAGVNPKVAERFPVNGKSERDEAIRRVQEAAEVSWLAKAQEAIRACAAAELKTLGVDVLKDERYRSKFKVVDRRIVCVKGAWR